MNALFGPAGNSARFYDEGYKTSIQMPDWLVEQGLECYEYSCGQGIRVKHDTAGKIGKAAKAASIRMSVHAPYFINLSNVDGDKRAKSRDYIYNTAQLASYFGADRVVFHPGACKGMDRDYALGLAIDELHIVSEELIKRNLSHITICPETMGKINQLGNLKEVVAMCAAVDGLIPTIDFGHLNARRRGSINGYDDYKNIIDYMGEKLGRDRIQSFHTHFSHIEYTKSGEKKHLTFEDDVYGPYFEPLAKLLVEYKLTPRIICESKGVMADDAMTMKSMYLEAKNLYE